VNRPCAGCAQTYDDFPSGSDVCDSCRDKQKYCSHKNTQGHADWTGTKVEFKCTNCGFLVKTIENQTQPLAKPISMMKPFTFDAPPESADVSKWKDKPSNLKGFYRRSAVAMSTDQTLDDGKPVWSYRGWHEIAASKFTPPKTEVQAVRYIDEWNALYGPATEYAVVQCTKCEAYHNQNSWVGTYCTTCQAEKKKILVLAGNHQEYLQYMKSIGENPDTNKGNYFEGTHGMFHGIHFSDIVVTGTFESRVDAASILAYANACLESTGKDKSMVCVKCGVYTKKCYPTNLCLNCYTVKLQSVVSKAKQAGIDPPKPFLLPKKEAVAMKNGEVRKLPQANSPLWTEQWAAQGSAKAPYIVSHKKGFNGATTDEGWACSCKDFTSHTPRADCKHICWVKKAEGITMTAPPIAALPKEQQEAFKQFLPQQAQKGNPVDKIDKPKPFVTQGRRFR
jgi:hypothetical protein